MTKQRSKIPDALMTIDIGDDDRVSTAVDVPPNTDYVGLGFPAAWDGTGGVNLLVSNDGGTTWRVAIDALVACIVGNADSSELIIQDSPVVSIAFDAGATDCGKHVEIAHRFISRLWKGSSDGTAVPVRICVAAQDNQTADRDIEVYFAG